MKFFIVFSLALAVAVAASPAYLDLLYNFDFNALFDKEEIRKPAFDCILEKTPCREDFQAVKDALVQVYKNSCGECNPEQKAKYNRDMKTFHDRFEPVYNEVIEKYGIKV